MARMYEDDYDEDDFTEVDESRLVKDLRKQLKDALKAKDELSTQVQTLSKTTRSQTLKDVLSSKNLNPKLANFYPADGEVTPEAVTTWVTEYADVFGVSTEPAEPEVDPAEAALHQRISSAGESNSSQDLNKFSDLESRIASAKNLEELQQILAGQ